MTDDEIIALSQTIEATLERYGVHLTTEQFNELDDFLGDLIASARENGE